MAIFYKKYNKNVQTEEKELYRFIQAPDWANTLSDTEIIALLVDTDFSR